MAKRNLKRVALVIGLVLMGMIFLASGGGLAKGYLTPEETTREATLVDYSHKGEFNWQAYTRPDLLSGQPPQPNPILFPQIVESLKILFAYSFEPDQALGEIEEEVEVRAILEERNGKWRKEIPLIPKTAQKGNFIIAFPLKVEEFFRIGDSIEKELAPKGLFPGTAGYRLEIRAEVETKSQTNPAFTDRFLATLKGKLSPASLEWVDGFESFERGWLKGSGFWHQGSFGYQAKLKPNEIFGPITLERKVSQEKPVRMNPDLSSLIDLIEAVDVGFSYQFESNPQADSVAEEVEVEMVIREPGRWKKSLTLLPATKKKDNFTLTFPLDIDRLREMANGINEEIGGKPGRGQEITITARVRTQAEVASKTIDEVFEQQLQGKIGEKIEWDKNLASTQKGEIKKEVKEFNLLAWQLRRYPWISLGASFLIFCLLGFLYLRGRPRPSFLERELKRARKKYKDILVEATELPSPKGGETVITMPSLEELAKAANNVAEPIFYKAEKAVPQVRPDRILYRILHGSVRYQYTCEEEKPEE